MRKLFGVALVGLVSACAQPMIWDKAGGTQEEFNRDDYNCRKDAIAAGGTVYLGYGVTSRNPDANMYQRCMVVAGYTLRQQQSGQALQTSTNVEGEAAARAIMERQKIICADPKFAPYYSKTACSANQITFEQLADTSKISPAAKAIFVELRNTVDAVNQESWEIVRKYGGAAGPKRADLFMATSKLQNDKNNLDLFNGQITWGEYNRRRQQIFADYTEAVKK